MVNIPKLTRSNMIKAIEAERTKRSYAYFVESMWDAYRADFGPVWTMSPTLNIITSGGSVSKNPDKAVYQLGRKVILNAVPDDGYEFAGWSGGLSGTDNPVTVIMHANRTIVANFTVRNDTLARNSK